MQFAFDKNRHSIDLFFQGISGPLDLEYPQYCFKHAYRIPEASEASGAGSVAFRFGIYSNFLPAFNLKVPHLPQMPQHNHAVDLNNYNDLRLLNDSPYLLYARL